MEEKELRDRTILLLALCCMSRPSDLSKNVVTRPRLIFGEHKPNQDGSVDKYVDIVMLGTKTDTKMDGRKVRVYEVSLAERCPIRHLRAYLQRTMDRALRFKTIHNEQVPLFLTTESYARSVKEERGLTADTIASILKHILDLAGIKSVHGQGKISARSIRPTAATQAFAAGISLTDILDTGGWSTESADLLRKHYLRPCRRNNVSSSILM